jgi:DNA invertase Pin-like site-specific DNA recombinase
MSVTTVTTRQDTVRAALYARVSTTDQSVARQYEANRQAAADAGWHVTEYEDPGKSASRYAKRGGGASRAGWSRLLTDLSAGAIDVLVLWEPSRGDRQLTGWSQLLDTCRAAGVLLHITSHRRSYDLNNPRDWRSLAEDGIDSAYESEKLRQRIMDGKGYWTSQGHPAGGRAPYGIRRVNADRPRNRWDHDEPDPATKPIVRRIILAVGAEVPYRVIARQLTAEGIPTPTGGKTWSMHTVRGIAANEIYVTVGIVTAEESNRARARLAATKGMGPGKGTKAQKARYSTVIRCAVCRDKVKGAAGRYRCNAGHVSIPAEDLDWFCDTMAVRWLARLTPEQKKIAFPSTDSGEALAAMAEAELHRAAIRDAARDAATKGIPLDAITEYITVLDAKAKAAEERARLAQEPGPLATMPGDGEDAIRAWWDDLTLVERKRAFSFIAPEAELHPGRRGHSARGTGRHGGGMPLQERIILWPEGE